jgi:hypothetical protein
VATKNNRAIVEQWMNCLATGNHELFWQIHAKNVIYNISGHTVISGRIQGRERMKNEIAAYVFGGLDLARSRFATKWKIMCADEDRVVAMMEADCYASNGVQYDQRYLHIFAFRDNQISEVWEFFDTDLANRALFTPEHAVPRSTAHTAFDF